VSGKGFVLWQASQYAVGEWLLFVDADTEQHQDGLWRAISFVQANRLKAMSASGIYINSGFLGEILEGLIYIPVFMGIPLRKVNCASRKEGWMNGQFILFQRGAYQEIQGHFAIRDCAFDDLSMGSYLKKKNIPYKFLPAGQLFHCFNYVGLKEAFSNWARLLAGGTPWMGVSRFYFITTIFILFLTSILPFALCAFGPSKIRSIAVLQVILVLVLALLNRFSMKLPLWRVVFLPIAALLVIGVYIEAYRLRFFRNSILWKGRAFKPDAVLVGEE
jgi:hypothetical protein